MRERRPADAEVIERQSHTDGTQARQDMQSPLPVGPTVYREPPPSRMSCSRGSTNVFSRLRRRGPRMLCTPGVRTALAIEPGLRVAAAQLDQRFDELGGEEQVAQKVAADRVAAGVQQPPEQRQPAVVAQPARARVVAL